METPIFLCLFFVSVLGVSEFHPCATNPCENGGICKKKGLDFECQCDNAHFGRFCQSTCKCAENGVCIKYKESVEPECRCNRGYGVYKKTEGIRETLTCRACECGTDEKGRSFSCSFKLVTDSEFFYIPKGICLCRPEDGYYLPTYLEKCAKCDCGRQYDGTQFKCINYEGCDCGNGYNKIGNKCREINPCDSNPCQNGGACEKLDGPNFKCNCEDTHSGRFCEIELDPCRSSPCLNGGTCHQENSTEFSCHCTPSHTGQICETACKCSANEICVTNEETGEPECRCSPGYGKFDAGIFVKAGICKECKCGKENGENGEKFSCIFKSGMFSDTKQCICKTGYVERSGTCKDCQCGEDNLGQKFGCTRIACVCDSPGYERKGSKCEPTSKSVAI